MRGTTLLGLLTQLRAEVGASLAVEHNVQARDTQIYHLQRAQEALWDDYTWAHLRVYRYISLAANTRYYDPAGCKKYSGASLVAAGDMAIDRVEKLWIRDGSIWRPMDVGIAESHFNAWNSDTGQASWPPRRWQVAEGNQIEVWPIPSLPTDETNGLNIIRMHGVRNLAPLVAETDVADLDDRLIVLTAAARMKSGEEGQKLAAMAQKRLLKVRGNNVKTRKFKMFGDKTPERVLRGPPTVYYRTTS